MDSHFKADLTKVRATASIDVTDQDRKDMRAVNKLASKATAQSQTVSDKDNEVRQTARATQGKHHLGLSRRHHKWYNHWPFNLGHTEHDLDDLYQGKKHPDCLPTFRPNSGQNGKTNSKPAVTGPRKELQERQTSRPNGKPTVNWPRKELQAREKRARQYLKNYKDYEAHWVELESFLEASHRRSAARAATQGDRAAKPRARSPRRKTRTPRDPNSPHEIERSKEVREANEKLANEPIVPRTRPRVVRFVSPPGGVVNQDEHLPSGTSSRKIAGSANRTAEGYEGHKRKEMRRDDSISDQGFSAKETWLRLPFPSYKAAARMLACCGNAAGF